MKNVIYCFLLILLLSACDTFKENAEMADFIPANTSVIIKTASIDNLINTSNGNTIISKISTAKGYKTIGKSLQQLSQINTAAPMLLCFSNNNNTVQQTIITTYKAVNFLTDSITKLKTKTITLKNKTVYKTPFNNNVLYSLVKDSLVISSTSKAIILNIIQKKNSLNPAIKTIVNTSAYSNTNSSIIVDAKHTNLLTSLFINDSIPFSKFTNYLAFETDIDDNDIVLNGVTKATDSTNSLINSFKNTLPQENEIAKITPSNANGFLSITFDDFNVFKNNLSLYNKTEDTISAPETTLFDNSNEIGVIYEGNNQVVVLRSIDNLSTQEALANEQHKISTYRGVGLYQFSQKDVFANTCAPFINFKDAALYFVLDNFFVFTKTKDDAQNIIANYQNKTTLNSKKYYTKLKTQLSDEASILQVTAPLGLQKLFQKNKIPQTKINFKNYNASALQFIYDTDFAHFNTIIKTAKTRNYNNSVNEEFNFKLDADVLNAPQFVINYTNRKTKDIVVQDVKNKLYLISNTGKLIWKKQLDGPVLGKIKQLDIYKNGRLQLVFATPHKVYIIPRSGKKVKPFPLKFKTPITQPLSVFDYDKKRNYRLLVTQGKTLSMYDAKGKIVSGFKFKNTKETLLHQPQHFKIRNTDYIVLKTEHKVYILSRTGQQKITPKSKNSYSKEAFYLNKGLLTTTTKSGDIIRIDHKGNVSKQRTKLSEKHAIDASSKTVVTQKDNKLRIRTNNVELDFGNYTRPKLFYINNKIYVSVTDLQTQKVHLLNSLAKPINNFPVYGNSTIDLDNIDKDRALEFVTKGESNSIILYEIN